jgi:hypothetical protein
LIDYDKPIQEVEVMPIVDTATCCIKDGGISMSSRRNCSTKAMFNGLYEKGATLCLSHK